MDGDVRVVQVGSVAEADLGRDWVAAHTSWGARLRLPAVFDPAPFNSVTHAVATPVVELGPEFADAVLEHERRLRADYPGGPATAPSVRDTASARALWNGGRVFGALMDDQLVAVTAVRVTEGRVETEFTSVAATHRRAGLAAAVKARSVLALAADGHRIFGTGGADENTASIRMNERLGYRIEERWRTYVRRATAPGAPQER